MDQVFLRKFLILCILALVGFLILTTMHIHGFSLSAWHEQIDGSPSKGILFGRARLERGDDWLVNASNILAQVEHKPPFPLVNSNIGSGQNMAVYSCSPILHPVGVFRPWTWGFFVSRDFGFAWYWWFRVIGLLVAATALFGILSGGRFYLSLVSSIALLSAPFLQYWSLNNAEVQLSAASCFVFFVFLVKAETRIAKTCWSVALGWMGACFLNTLYPAYQVPLAYFLLACLVGWLATQMPTERSLVVRNLGWIIVSLVTFGLGAASLYWAVGDVLPTIQASSYPGTRFETGGNYRLLQYFSFILKPSSGSQGWGLLGNPSEGASWYGIFPFLLSCAAGSLFLVRKFKAPMTWCFATYLVILLVYTTSGFPPWLAKVSFFSQMPAKRAVIGFGLGTFALAIALNREVFGSNKHVFFGKPRVMLCLVGIVAQLILVAAALSQIASLRLSINERHVYWAASGLVFVTVLMAWRIQWGLTILGAWGFASTVWYNPVVKGGTEFLYENPLSEKMVALQKSNPTGRWLVFHSIFAM